MHTQSGGLQLQDVNTSNLDTLVLDYLAAEDFVEVSLGEQSFVYSTVRQLALLLMQPTHKHEHPVQCRMMAHRQSNRLSSAWQRMLPISSCSRGMSAMPSRWLLTSAPPSWRWVGVGTYHGLMLMALWVSCPPQPASHACMGLALHPMHAVQDT